jgi:hypothetical protein
VVLGLLVDIALCDLLGYLPLSEFLCLYWQELGTCSLS